MKTNLTEVKKDGNILQLGRTLYLLHSSIPLKLNNDVGCLTKLTDYLAGDLVWLVDVQQVFLNNNKIPLLKPVYQCKLITSM